jgi:hypothetical protein
MSDTSIPDSVSADMLRGLLGKDLPDSSSIPRLDFGGRYGAPCDLQFAVSLMVAQSASGVNIVQAMVAAMHLLGEAHLQLTERLTVLKDGSDPEIQEAPEEVRDSIANDLSRQAASLNSAIVCLEQVITALAGFACHHRLKHLLDVGELKSGPITRGELLSRMLISSELLDTLALSRKQLTTYLESQQP